MLFPSIFITSSLRSTRQLHTFKEVFSCNFSSFAFLFVYDYFIEIFSLFYEKKNNFITVMVNEDAYERKLSAFHIYNLFASDWLDGCILNSTKFLLADVCIRLKKFSVVISLFSCFCLFLINTLTYFHCFTWKKISLQ